MEPEDFTPDVDTEETPKRKSLYCQPDDLEVGSFYTVLGLKRHKNRPIPIAGQAFKVTALSLPFMVVELAVPGGHPPVTLDTRYLDFMKVDRDFALAQVGSNVEPTPQHPLAELFGGQAVFVQGRRKPNL